MKTYDKNIRSKIKTFTKKSFKQKTNCIFVLLGVNFLINRMIYLLLSFFIKNKMTFFKRIFFDINKKKSSKHSLYTDLLLLFNK